MISSTRAFKRMTKVAIMRLSLCLQNNILFWNDKIIAKSSQRQHQEAKTVDSLKTDDFRVNIVLVLVLIASSLNFCNAVVTNDADAVVNFSIKECATERLNISQLRQHLLNYINNNNNSKLKAFKMEKTHDEFVAFINAAVADGGSAAGQAKILQNCRLT